MRLLEDKKALEVKVQELQQTLSVVQDQRNELRQQVRTSSSHTDMLMHTHILAASGGVVLAFSSHALLFV